MGSFANLSANLKLNIQDFSRQLRLASRQANAFAANLNGQTVSAMRELNKQTNAWGLNMKSVSRVVSGIVISQTFYAMLQNIRAATDAVWEFSKQLEYAQIAYSNLFGDTQLAQEFINVLKDFAALTPFGFTEAEKAAKRLLAYGIEYKNVMYVMNGVLTASAAQGDSMKIEQISRALGQIYTYGKLMTAEVRQLTEAGIPVYDILQEKLGLTQEQLRNLGRESIPASVAINALVDGINERFGNVLEASSKTIQGIISNIKDNATMLFAGIFEPFTVYAKSVLYEVGQFFFKMRELFETAGTGGVFEAIFPPEMHAILRQFVANIKASIQATLHFVVTLSQLLKPVLLALLQLYNAFSPILTALRNMLYGLIGIITENARAMKLLTFMIASAAAMWVVFKVRALAAAVVTTIVTGISKAFAGLAAVLTFVVAHPIWALLIGLTGVIVGISGGFGKLSEKVNGFFKSLTQFNGVDPNKILLPSQKERANDLEKFNEKLGGTSDAMDDLADSTGKATKAAKGLLSFDEVFKLNEPDEGAGAGGGIDASGLEDALAGIGGLGDAYIPEIPDFGEYMNNFKTNFVDKFRSIWDDIKDNVLTAGLGAILGAVLGGFIGGPTGAKIGAAIGALAGWFWSTLADKLGISDHGKVTTMLAGLVGTMIGSTLGHPVIGGAIGLLVGFIISTLIDGIESGDPYKIAMPIGTLTGAGIGMVVGGPAGAIIGAGIGTLVGWLAGLLADGIKNHNPTKIATPIGTLVGAAIGGVVGGPIGAAIGAAIGALVGFITGKFAEADWGKIQETVGIVVHEAIVLVGSFIAQTLKDFKEWVDKIKDTFNEWKTDTLNKVTTWVSDTKNSFNSWKTETFSKISTWVSDVKSSINDWKSDTFSKVSTWVSDTKNSFNDWKSNTYSRVSTWASDVKSTFNSWKTDTYNKVTTWVTDTKKSFSEWKTNTYNNISTWITDTIKDFAIWATNVKKTISDWWTNVKSKFDAFKELSFTSWAKKTFDTLSEWASDVWYTIRDKIGKAIDKVKEFFNLNSKNNGFSVSASVASRAGHATGGIFDREHIARFAEGNKAEAVIPLENASAMQPFVDAISRGIIEGIAPSLANISGGGAVTQQGMPPLYVGTLIADERGIRELYKKFEIIQVQENARKGLA